MPNHLPQITSIAILLAATIHTNAAMPGGSTIYAGLWTTDEATPQYGIYSLDGDDAQLLLADPKGTQVGYPIRSAWIADGKLCGYYVKESYSVVEEMHYIEIDPEGNVTTFTQLPDDQGYFFTATYNPDDRCVYGYGLTADYSYALMKAPAANPGEMQSVREFSYDADEECLSIAYDTEGHTLYGINVRGQLVKIDTATGLQTNLAKVPFSSESIISGMCYSPRENLLYWNAQLPSSSAIYTISTDTYAFTQVATCPHNEQYNFMVCPDKASAPTAPAAPAIKAVGFDNGATTGSVTITMPTLSASGATLAGTLRWQAYLDNLPAADGTAAPGADVVIPFADLTEGNHLFAFKASEGDAASEAASHYMWIGCDTPKAPAKVILTHDRVHWTRVTEGVNGGWIDPDNLEYEAFIDGEHIFYQGALNLWGEHQLSKAELKRYTATVVARSNGKTSQPTESNELALGRPLQPGFTLIPDEDDVNRMSVIDVNGDDRTWSYSLYQECAKSSFGSGIPMDDWLILSPVEFKKETSYTLSIDVQTCSSIYLDEAMRVCIGTSPDPAEMTRVLIDTFQPQRAINTWTTDFTLPADGTYYIGFHTTSAPDQEGLLLSNIRLHRTGDSAITATEADTTDLPAEYYNLQGIRVHNPSAGLYLLRRGNTTTKVTLP